MNVLTDTGLCLEGQSLLNICKLKRQTMTVRYSVAIIMFWWQFFGDADGYHSFTTWQHKLTTIRACKWVTILGETPRDWS